MRNYHIGTITGIPIRVNVTLLVFLPVLAWLIARPGQIAIYAGFIEGISPHTVDVEALQTGVAPAVIGVATAVGLFGGVVTTTDFARAIEVLQGIGPRRDVATPDGYA